MVTEQPIGKRGGVTIIWTVFFVLVFLASRFWLRTTDHFGWVGVCAGSICGAIAYRLQIWNVTFLDRIANLLSNVQTYVPGCRRKPPNRGMRIYVAGPYTAPFDHQVLKNVQRAIDAALTLYKKGYQPYIPHLTHYIDKRAQELGLTISREDYVRRWDGPWLTLCDAVLYLAESPGAREELQLAQSMGKTVFYGSADDTPEAI